MSAGDSSDRSTDAERARWEERWGALADRVLPPSRWLVEHRAWLPAGGRALDWAGGDGRNALWLAEEGFQVTLADISPTALATAGARAEAQGLTLETECLDLSCETPAGAPWDLILCHHYFDPQIAERALPLLSPEGRLIIHHPTRRNLEKHPRPPAHFLYEEGELATLLADHSVLFLEETWTAAERHEVSACVAPSPKNPPAS